MFLSTSKRLSPPINNTIKGRITFNFSESTFIKVPYA